jgi:hypothetical protein
MKAISGGDFRVEATSCLSPVVRGVANSCFTDIVILQSTGNHNLVTLLIIFQVLSSRLVQKDCALHIQVHSGMGQGWIG